MNTRHTVWLRFVGLMAMAAGSTLVSRYLDALSRRVLLGLGVFFVVLALVSLLTMRRTKLSKLEKRAAERMEKKTQDANGKIVAEADKVKIGRGLELQVPKPPTRRGRGH